jgi:hypothetical protein
MTREEILGMEAGRELDKLIGFYIFGYGIPANIPPDKDLYIRFKVTSNIVNGKADCEEILPIPLKCYSTDIKAAWEVVEKMREKSFYVRVNSIGKYFECCFIKNFVNENNTPGSFIGLSNTCKTVPEAICKAALLAVLEEKAEM